jgi:hypothetical protein
MILQAFIYQGRIYQNKQLAFFTHEFLLWYFHVSVVSEIGELSKRAKAPPATTSQKLTTAKTRSNPNDLCFLLLAINLSILNAP